jgi:hypothetical protein
VESKPGQPAGGKPEGVKKEGRPRGAALVGKRVMVKRSEPGAEEEEWASGVVTGFDPAVKTHAIRCVLVCAVASVSAASTRASNS